MSKIESIFGARDRGKFGCGFLSQRDVDDLLTSELEGPRFDRLEQHRLECEECVHLLAAVERFRAVIDDGVLESEARQFAESEQAVKARLREEFALTLGSSGRRGSPPWGREMSTDELEYIAAAGPDGPQEPLVPENEDEKPDDA